jgi:hypothetical protein
VEWGEVLDLHALTVNSGALLEKVSVLVKKYNGVEVHIAPVLQVASRRIPFLRPLRTRFIAPIQRGHLIFARVALLLIAVPEVEGGCGSLGGREREPERAPRGREHRFLLRGQRQRTARFSVVYSAHVAQSHCRGQRPQSRREVPPQPLLFGKEWEKGEWAAASCVP